LAPTARCGSGAGCKVQPSCTDNPGSGRFARQYRSHRRGRGHCRKGPRRVALRSDGTLWAWGANGAGELGDLTTVDRDAPVQVAGLANVARIGAGTTSSYAATSDGRFAWGSGKRWVFVGDGTFVRSAGSAPLLVANVSNPRAIAGSAGLNNSNDIVAVLLKAARC